MNTHQNLNHTKPWRDSEPPANITPYITDNMPAAVATEMLCRPGVRMTNTERKQFHDARALHFVSTRTAKPEGEKLAAKLKTASMNQLGKWLKRVISGRQQAQVAFVRYQKHEQRRKEDADRTNTEFKPNPLIEKLMAALDLKAAQFDIMREHLDAEVARRDQLVINNQARKVAARPLALAT